MISSLHSSSHPATYDRFVKIITSKLIALGYATIFCLLVTSCTSPPPPEVEVEVEAAEEEPATPPIKLPGIEIDTEGEFVDVEAKVCLEEGLLELVACTTGTKEHESVVVIDASPIHIHTALLLIGARNGNPAMRKPINEEQTRWMHLPPQGDPIEVSRVCEDADGNPVERPISDFITRSEGDPYMQDMGYDDSSSSDGEKEEAFPDTFVFAGSHLIENENGETQYLAEQSGNLISISTFGDELLCLSGFQSRENGQLVWEIDPTHLPALDTQVTLRLRLKPSP